jgi:hypothetical protein
MEQIAAYCACALASGVMFHRWRMLDPDYRQRIWLLYGWFSGLMLSGSCVGIVTWAAWMQSYITFYNGQVFDLTSNPSAAQREQYTLSLARSRVWFALFYVAYAVEFLCLTLAKLMVLDRMAEFAKKRASDVSGRRLVLGKKVLIWLVISGNLVGLAANIAAAAHRLTSSESYATASAYFATNNTISGEAYLALGTSQNRLAIASLNYHYFSEVAVLMLIVVAFAYVGFTCSGQIKSSLASLSSAGAASQVAAVGKTLQLQVVSTTLVVFVAFLLRSVFSIMWAFAFTLSDQGRDEQGDGTCPQTALQKCDPCYNDYTHLAVWMNRMPEFQTMIVLVSSPLALLVALYGMTSSYMLQLLKQNAPNKITKELLPK